MGMRESMIKVSDLKEVIRKMDNARKEDLLLAIVGEVFDHAYDYEADRLDAIIEVIENVTDMENLQVLLYE